LRLSVIIVSYNVYPFLDNCLRSVRQALKKIDGEIIVVDNASVDRTVELVKNHFPDVTVIANTRNGGFAVGNNQGIVASKGEFILLLNPDTIVSEDTFMTCLDFMDQHPDAGAIGVKMLDGSGQFLPESKRGLPTLLSSFMKMSGLYHLFPRSSKWNNYYQGYIGENETAKIDVLCGAFMFMRKKVLDETGYLDEAFFMYGEDIDLSYRISKAGHSIYYLPTTSIIHYKGESTRKSSLNYILTFYEAMLIFTEKHPTFKGQKLLIKIAIYFHGLFQLLRQTITKWWPVAMDAVMFIASFYLVSKLWAVYNFRQASWFKPSFYYINLPLYTVIMLLSIYLNGAYDRPYLKRNSWLGFFTGLLMILVIYAVLPAHLRSSRMVVIMGSSLCLLSLLLTRNKMSPWDASARNADPNSDRNTIIVAGEEESGRIRELINRSRDHLTILGTVSPSDDTQSLSGGALGRVSQLEDLVRVYQVKEIIFSAQDVPFSVFTGSMTKLGPSLRYMLAASTTMNIVGSMSRDREGESYAIRVHFNLSDPSSVRAKRIFDFLSSLLILIVSPILVFFINGKLSFFRNLISVLGGKKTWVSYHPIDPTVSSLPPLRNGILHPAYPQGDADLNRRLQHIHYVYARDYHWTTDLSILITQCRQTGQIISGYGQ
jgi:GT2 family glycosyltransferase